MGAAASNFCGGDSATDDERGAGAALKRLSRSRELPAVRSVEDLLPPELFFKTVAGSLLMQQDIANVTVVNRQFKETCYNARMLTGRGAMALIGQGCEPSVAEAKKWYTVAADMYGTREALCMLGAMASGGASPTMLLLMHAPRPGDLGEAERYFRAAIAAEASPPDSYVMFAPAGHALDVVRLDLAHVLLANGGSLDEVDALLDAVLDHGPIPPKQPLRHPHMEASVMKALMIHSGEVEGTLGEALALLEAVPEEHRQSQCEYLLGKIYKDLDEASPNDEYAKKAFYHINKAMGKLHGPAAFDLGELAENGRGTETNLVTAYTSYILGSSPGRDERAIARVRELRAAGPPYGDELTVAVAQWLQMRALRPNTSGRPFQGTIEEALELIIVGEPQYGEPLGEPQ